MKCTRVALGPDVTVVFCGSRPRRRNCQTPGCTNAGAFECDAPVKRAEGKSQTCDRMMCGQCRVVRPNGEDYCAPHARKADEAARAVKETRNP